MTINTAIPDFDPAVANFKTSKQVFNQHSYEETIEATADMLVTLEALRKDIVKIMSEMADIEVYIYGNSQDVHDNNDEVDANGNNIGANRHSLNGIQNRTHDLQD